MQLSPESTRVAMPREQPQKMDLYQGIIQHAGQEMGIGLQHEKRMFFPATQFEHRDPRSLEDMAVDAQDDIRGTVDYREYFSLYVEETNDPAPGWIYGYEAGSGDEFDEDDGFEEFDPDDDDLY